MEFSTREFNNDHELESDLYWNGHTHTEFCRHGDKAPLKMYLEQAIKNGLKRYSVTEHPPLPKDWLKDPYKMKKLEMPADELESYFLMVERMKDFYQGTMDILSGLELDYLYGKESFTTTIVDQYQHKMDDAIVSVHFLPGRDGMYCIDWSSEDLKSNLLNYYGNMDNLIDCYYEHVEFAIQFAASLPFKKVRIGHINLIQKFQSELPAFDMAKMNAHLKRLLVLLKKTGVLVDGNTAGLRVPTCGVPYVPEWFIYECTQNEIGLVFGSDAHKPSDVASGWNWYRDVIEKSKQKTFLRPAP